MGQTGSTGQGESSFKATDTNKTPNKYHSFYEIEELFTKRVLQQYTPAELLGFKRVTGESSDLTSPVSKDLIIKRLYLPKDNNAITDLVLSIFRTLSNYPFINKLNENMTIIGLLKATTLLSKRNKKYIGSRNFSHITLIFIVLSNYTKAFKKSETELINESYSIEDLVSSYDDTNLDKTVVPINTLLHFITWLLILSYKCPTTNCTIKLELTAEDWKSYELCAKSIIRSMNSRAYSGSSEYDTTGNIQFDEFSTVMNIIVTHILKPLENLVEHLLFIESDLVPHSSYMDDFEESKLLRKPLFTQLISSLPKEIAITKLQKLYVGRESGFSMRSLQAKVFKWVAPTVLLVSGMRIADDDEYATKENPRYNKFLQTFHKLRDDDQHLEECFIKKRKVIFAVYIEDPWKVTNKSYFGTENTTIIQLSPRQDIYKANSKDVVYFNTVGGGIGIGSSQPTIKTTLQRYEPGNVSLTLDSALEFAVFRHVGHGGKINTGNLHIERENLSNSFELRFIIQDVEVWGCGGAKELEEQVKQLKWEEAEAKRRQHINLKSLGEDRALLEMAGLVGQHQSGGSV